jgi:hypothetical protein
MKIKAYQIYYDKSQHEHLLDGFDEHYNETATVFLESGIMCDLIDLNAEKCDWFGVFSWKVYEKLRGFNHNRLVKLINNNSKADIIGPDDVTRHKARPPKHESLYHYKNKKKNYHTDIKKTFNYLIELLQGLNIVSANCNFLNVKMNQIYYNAFVAKYQIYKDFIDTMLKPSIELFNTNETLKQLSIKDAGYPTKPPKRFCEHTGLINYPQIPFILERLINLYIYNKQTLNVEYKL